MPPRIPTPARPTLAAAGSSTAAAAPLAPAPLAARSFTTTSPREKMTRRRREMFMWLESPRGQRLAATGYTGGPRYVGPAPDQPFPLNPQFRSQPVLSEGARELIFERVTGRGEALKAVAADVGVDVRRVAAVVRLKAVEKQWQAEDKKLAKPYAKAVMKMLPQTHLEDGEKPTTAHEPVNDIHVHKYTLQQLFVPVSESRHFTREDAAAAFHERMLSVDKRSPQRQLIDHERRVLGGAARDDSQTAFQEQTRREEEAVAERILRRQRDEARRTQRVETDRYEFRFRDVSVQDVGPVGRSRDGTGWRYGAPHEDRKKGQVKIPTSVP